MLQRTSAACCVATQRTALQRNAARCSGVRNQLIGLAQYASQLERVNADIAAQARARAQPQGARGRVACSVSVISLARWPWVGRL
jgi:hypothetical protein